MKRLRDTKHKITVGVHAAEGAQTYPDGTTVADVASWNHFGTEHIPARPFVTGWFDANQGEIRKQMTAAGERILYGLLPMTAFQQLALWAEGRVKAFLAQGVPPPDATATAKRKGSSTPLINTGQLRASIRGVVE